MSSAAAVGSVAGQWRESFFSAPDGTQLYHASIVPASPRAVVVVAHGYDDHALRYRHVMEAFAQAGFAAHALDFRGHGHAGGRRGFTTRFADYTTDLRAFLSRVRAESGALPLFIVAHSHGGLVVGTLMSSAQAPGDVAGVILSSPYYQLRIAPSAFQLFQAKVMGRLIPFLPIKSPLNSSMLTKDVAMQKAADVDPLKHRVVTPRWFTESNAAQVALLEQAKEFKVPMLMLLGAEDGIAHPEGGKQFFEAAGSSDKQLKVYDGMLHEVFNEVERDKPIGEAIAWINRHLEGKASAA